MSEPSQSSETTRTAHCKCGDIKVTVKGEPGGVNICSCTACQRVSGSAFSYTTFFPDAQVVSIEGKPTTYTSKGDAGRESHSSFCPTCGSPVFNKLDVLPGILGVYAGCFADPTIRRPENYYHVVTRPHWLGPIERVTDNQTQ